MKAFHKSLGLTTSSTSYSTFDFTGLRGREHEGCELAIINSIPAGARQFIYSAFC